MKLGELWRRWQTSGHPEHMLTEAEAIERVRQYAEINGRQFSRPVSVRLQRRALQPGKPKAGFRFIYVMDLGTSKPMPRVEVDASNGEVLAWRTPPR